MNLFLMFILVALGIGLVTFIVGNLILKLIFYILKGGKSNV